MTQEQRACPICHSDSTQALYQNTMATIDGLDMSYRVARCDSCALVFADRLPAASDYESYYRALSKYDAPPMLPPGSKKTAANMSNADHLRCDAAIALIRTYAADEARIVDLGCGSGMLLNALRDAGWSMLMGVDPAPGAAEQAHQLYGLDCVQCGTLQQAAGLPELATFDVVCMMGVLEHLPQPHTDLARLIDALGKDVKLLVEVPALERFSRKSFEPYGEFSLEHVQYFSATSLCRFFSGLGFVPQALSILDLPEGYCDSLLGMFARAPAQAQAEMLGAAKTAADLPEANFPENYLSMSEKMMLTALQRMASCPSANMVIYGAGSHTARLLPRLRPRETGRIKAIVDGNPNLQGKRMGYFVVEAPAALGHHANATIVVSSFRSQTAIAEMLRATRSNPILTLY